MAPENRPTTHHLAYFSKAQETVKLWGLLALLRGAESRALHLPRIGRSRLPDQNIVDLAQSPSLGFAQSTLEDIVVKGGRTKVIGFWLGLVGPMGPLPTHLTEFTAYEKRYAKKHPFGDFLNLISGRMLQLFYRAWAQSQPCASVDRPDDDHFGQQLAMLSGAFDTTGPGLDFPSKARLHYAGLLASKRSARGIEDALTHLMGQSVKIEEFQPRWQQIESDDQSRLGRQFAQLGRDIVVGRRIRTANEAFNVVIATSSLREYESLLPGGHRFGILRESIKAFAPSHLSCEIRLQIAESMAPAARLSGRSRLGLTSWLKPKKIDTMRQDARIRA